jgi:hypothetical protein
MIRKLALYACIPFALATLAQADISGSDPHAALPTLDTCVGCVFAYIDFTAGNAGQTVLSYQFYNGAGQGTTNNLTPLLLEKTGLRTFTILGIGTTATGFNAGYNDVNFGLQSGSAVVVDANTFFGYVDGTASGLGNTGTIVSNYPTGPGATSYYTDPVGALTVGQAYSTFNAFTDVPVPNQNNRTYSLQVTTTPEPGFYGLLAAGLGALGFAVARRKRNHFNS